MNSNKEKYTSNNAKTSGGEGFSSAYGFLMTAIGLAVGVGSLWRFPYICGTNGGALFILVYIIIVLIIGMPLLAAEMSMGYITQKTAINAYKDLTPKNRKCWHVVSYLHIAAAQMIYSYTIPIYAYLLIYIWRTSTGFFSGLGPKEIEPSFTNLQSDFPLVIFFALLNWLMVALVVNKGLQGGIEKLSKILLPALAVIMAICIFVGLQVPGSMKGVEFLLKPDISSFSFKSVMAALGQALFAIGIAMLGSMVFGSYLKGEKENLFQHSMLICIAIIVAGIAAGFTIFPLVFAFNLEPSAGMSLTLITLPNVFNYITGGRIVGTLFYVGFYVAAFTSAIGIMEAIVAVMMESMKLTRSKAVLSTTAIGLVIGTTSIISPSAFQLFDYITSDYLIVLGALGLSIFVGWIWGIKNFLSASGVTNPAIRLWLTISVKYLCPVAIAVIFIGNMIQNFK